MRVPGKLIGRDGFTLIELVVVMAIIAVLASLMVGAFMSVKNSATDRKKVSGVREILPYLEAYNLKRGQYPAAVSTGACSWEVGNANDNPRPFLDELSLVSFSPVPRDDTAGGAGNCTGYRYYRYPAGSYGCPGGSFYVLGIDDLRGVTSKPNASSPGFSCGTRNWSTEFDWVTGSFQ